MLRVSRVKRSAHSARLPLPVQPFCLNTISGQVEKVENMKKFFENRLAQVTCFD